MTRISAPTILNSKPAGTPSAGAWGPGPFSLRRYPNASSGFTLLEVLIVMGLIGLLSALYITDMGGLVRVSLDKSARELATVIRTTHDEAILKGQVYRLAFDLDKGQYWAEVTDKSYLMRTEEQAEEERRRRERLSEEERAQLKDPFSLAKSVTKKKLGLPIGVKFTEIQTPRFSEAVKGGMVYAHVFPHGFIEKLVIHLKDTFDREFTLAVNPVTGKTRVFQHYVKDPDA